MKDGVETDGDSLLFPTFGYRSKWWFVLKEVLRRISHPGFHGRWDIKEPKHRE